jgi:hypothetical protein
MPTVRKNSGLKAETSTNLQIEKPPRFVLQKTIISLIADAAKVTEVLDHHPVSVAIARVLPVIVDTMTREHRERSGLEVSESCRAIPSV